MTHELKIWPQYFKATISGEKRFEVRKNDRNYAVGDMLRLREFDPQTQTYTGRKLIVDVTYIMHGGQFGLEPSYCILATRFKEIESL